MMAWTSTQKFIFLILVILCVNYLGVLAVDRLGLLKASNTTEGFEGTVNKKGESNDLYTWITDPQLIYDEFYAGVYDQLSQQSQRTQAKVILCKSIWEKSSQPIHQWSVLDAGCGTGHAIVAFAKQGVGRIVGLDFSPAMLRHAEQKVLPAAKLSPKESEVIRWRQDTLVNSSACSAGEFTHAIVFYFTFYYVRDKEELFRHFHLWTKPGGKLVIEVVNKHKFDPILESASPFLGFSLQKYSKDRIRKSKVTFDKFEYEAEFQLHDPKAEFYETFRFKNNHVRRQKHEFTMPTIADIVAMGTRSGWKYTGFQDLNPLGFEYGYLLFFEK